MFTSIELLALAVTYRIYDQGLLIYEQSDLIDQLQFPVQTLKRLVPITRADKYIVEATISGPFPGISVGTTLFQGVVETRLVPSHESNVLISMVYTGFINMKQSYQNHVSFQAQLLVRLFWEQFILKNRMRILGH